MSIVQNKEKLHDTQYQSSSSESSIEEWRHTFVSKNRRLPLGQNNSFTLNRSEVITEKSLAIKQKEQKAERQASNRYKTDRTNILTLKERIAHYVSIVKARDDEILDLKQCITRLGEVNKLKDKQVQQLKKVIEAQSQTLVQEKAEVNVLYNSIKSNEQDIQMQRLDNQLLSRHVNFYKSQIAKLKQELVLEDKKKKQLQIRLEEINQLKTENARLVEDGLRIKFLLRESDKYKKLGTKIQYKHYVGRPTTESDNWVSGQLIDDVKKLVEKLELKTQQRKRFQDHIIRFVNKHTNKVVEEETKKIKKQWKAKLKFIDRQQHYFSLNKNNNQKQKTKQKSCFSRSITEASGCHRARSLCSNKLDICSRILKEMKEKVNQQLDENEISKARIKIVVQWAADAILAIHSSELEDQKSNFINKTMNTTNFL